MKKLNRVLRETEKDYQEFKSATRQEEKVYVYQNRKALSAEQIIDKHKRIQVHCDRCGYLRDGSISISVPMSRCGSEFKAMIDYCNSRGITKILVESMYDIGNNSIEVDKTVGILCGHGFEVETIDFGLIFDAKADRQQKHLPSILIRYSTDEIVKAAIMKNKVEVRL